MAEDSRISAPLKILIRLLLTIALVWALNRWMPDYVFVEGGVAAYIIIGSLLTLMNMLVRPLLNMVLLPFKLFMSIITIIVANGLFLWLTEKIAQNLDPAIVVLDVTDTLLKWLLVAIILGLANWVMKMIIK